MPSPDEEAFGADFGVDDCSEGKPRKKRQRADQVPHIDWRPGMEIGPWDRRYVVEGLLGDGVTGRVLLCKRRDLYPDEASVAIKISKPISRQRQHAQDEANVLMALQKHDGFEYVDELFVKLFDTFYHESDHFCLVLEPLPMSLRELLQSSGSGSQGLLVADIQYIAIQLLEALAFMHEVGFVHTDLKSTNVMLRDGRFDLEPHPRDYGRHVPRPRCRPCRVALIDFGMAERPRNEAVDDAELKDECAKRKSGVRVGARHVRAPEVILGIDWTCKIDTWSLGCLLYTLYTGDRLFSGVHDDAMHLAVMEQVCEDSVPEELIRAANPRLTKGLALDGGHFIWPEVSDSDLRNRSTLRQSVLPRHGLLSDLICGLVDMRPWRRLSAKEALGDPFVARGGMVSLEE